MVLFELSTKETEHIVLDEIEVRGERTVEPHHFWVGRSDTGAPEAGEPADG